MLALPGDGAQPSSSSFPILVLWHQARLETGTQGNALGGFPAGWLSKRSLLASVEEVWLEMPSS